jgi:acyl carrier protein
LADYAAANAFQSAFAEIAGRHPVIQTIEWDAWEAGGLAGASDPIMHRMQITRAPLQSGQAMAILDAVLADPGLTVCRVLGRPTSSPPAEIPRKSRYSPAEGEGLAKIRDAAARVLKLDPARIPDNVPLWDLGADSRSLLEILQRYEALSGTTITLEAVLLEPTLAGILHSASRGQLVL